MKSTKKSFQFGEHEVTIETGAIARQADGAVMVDMADTTVMVTAVGRKVAEPGRDFFPLTSTTRKRPMPLAESRADSSSVKDVQARKRF